MDEFARIATFFAPLAAAAGRELKDDAAVIAPPRGRELVLTVDQMLEGIHFLKADDPALIARKLLRRNLSDLAAMGAVPLGYLLTTALPSWVPDGWLARFVEGLKTDQEIFGLGLLGGDSSSAQASMSFTATLLGHVSPGEALPRSGAKVGDRLFVTGTIGDAALGLQARLGKLLDPTGYLAMRSLLPEPRTGLELAGIVSAAIDVSDGLIQDVGHICRASGIGAVIQAEAVPTSAPAMALGPDYLEMRLTGGDDYELVLAVPPENIGLLYEVCGIMPITDIGVCQAEAGVRVVQADGTFLNPSVSGWKHF